MNADNTLYSMTEAAHGMFPALGKFTGEQRRSLVRRIRYCAIDQIKTGERDPAKIRDACLERIQSRSDFSSILTLIGIQVLIALVEWIVKRLLDRWVESGDFLT